MLVVVVIVFLTGGFLLLQPTFPCHRHSTPTSQAREGFHWPLALPWLLSIALLLPGFFLHSFTASATVFSRHFLSTDTFYLTLLHRHFWNSLWLRCGQDYPIHDPPLCLPSQSCSFRLTHGLELLILYLQDQ